MGKAFVLAVAWGMLLGVLPSVEGAESTPRERFHGATPADDAAGDGDSFLVQTGERKFRVRLYYVDAPETGAYWESDLRRLREQMRYFGLTNEQQVLEFGRTAASFTRQALAQPFEVHTAFASALGRSSDGRVYAFVRTASGEDLAELLVKNGLARAYGVGREGPGNVSRNELKAHMADLEAAAMMKRMGIWKASDPDRLAELRAQQRKEDQAVKESLAALVKPTNVEYPLNLNTCSVDDLQSIRGIGPATARRIAARRPFRSLDELSAISGISTGKLAAWEKLLTLE